MSQRLVRIRLLPLTGLSAVFVKLSAQRLLLKASDRVFYEIPRSSKKALIALGKDCCAFGQHSLRIY